jgi:hypothetical protein
VCHGIWGLMNESMYFSESDISDVPTTTSHGIADSWFMAQLLSSVGYGPLTQGA